MAQAQPPTDLAVLHHRSISAPHDLGQVLERLLRGRVPLHNGMDRRNRTRIAWVKSIGKNGVILEHRNIDVLRHSTIYLSFDLDQAAFLWPAAPKRSLGDRLLTVSFPEVLHYVERRADQRQSEPSVDETVMLESESGDAVVAFVEDASPGGLGVRSRLELAPPVGSRLRVRFLAGPEAGKSKHAVVRHDRADLSPGWKRLGLSVSSVQSGPPVAVQRRREVLSTHPMQRAWRRIALAGRTLQVGPARAARRLGFDLRTDPIHLVDYVNQLGQPIRGILDRTSNSKGGPAILIPPAWGRTKETLAPLAATLVETFAAAGKPLTVLRFDGTQRRGESHIDPGCRAAGDENLRFTYSQAAQDLEASATYLRETPDIEASQIVLITFSLAAIEGRRALAQAPPGLFAGWVAVVGMADVQSAMKSVSGGMDYVLGHQHGVKFGVHELGGVRIDIDHAASDVVRSNLGTLEDARRDMAKISVPVTWIHGRHDGWTDLSRVRDLMSAGDTSRRTLIDVPTGHQLRNSREALETFQLIASEVSAMLGERLKPAIPNLARLEAQVASERARAPARKIDIRRFWHDYLIGRDETVGMQLLTATSVYRKFMMDQIAGLRLPGGAQVLDLGCGTGEFAVRLLELHDSQCRHVVCADLVPEALQRALYRISQACGETSRFTFVALDADQKSGLPFLSGAFDGVFASLVVSYLEDPTHLLAEIHRIVRPGGRILISSPKRDADLSSLYREMMNELTAAGVSKLIGEEIGGSFEEAQRNYLNEAARLVDIEESGRFRFRDPDELKELAKDAGFSNIRTQLSLGSPPQTAILHATRP